MLVYYVKWFHDSDLSKGKGRVNNKEALIAFTVLCRNSSDAVACFDWYFRHKYNNSRGLDPSDGVLTLTRQKLDSRNFNINYMFMDGIRMPVYLHNLKESLTDLTFNKY